jgi:hypothetical protein
MENTIGALIKVSRTMLGFNFLMMEPKMIILSIPNVG